VPVVTAGHDLAWGSVIGRDDVAVTRFPAGQVPVAALRDPAQVVGRRPASPVRRGEPITDVRLLGSLDPTAGAAAGPGAVAVPVRIADAAAARMLQPGMVVDVLAAPSEDFVSAPAPATLVAAGVRVLSVAPGEELSGNDGALVVLATTETVAARLATAAASGRLSVTWRL
jgi:Flp pilus assembly protein CpaB